LLYGYIFEFHNKREQSHTAAKIIKNILWSPVLFGCGLVTSTGSECWKINRGSDVDSILEDFVLPKCHANSHFYVWG
jgi:hypothetical protein